MQDVLEEDSLEETQIYVCDINPNMLNVGKKRAVERGMIEKFLKEVTNISWRWNLCAKSTDLGENKSLIWVEGDAEALSFGNDSMDGYTIAFGIRNVTHIEKVLAEVFRWSPNSMHWFFEPKGWINDSQIYLGLSW